MNITIDANFGMAVKPVTSTVLDFSDAAARKVKKLVEEEGNSNLKLRVLVQGGGCSGFQYGFSLDEEKQLRLTIFSLSGKVIFKKDYTFSSGDNTIRWKAPNDLKAGTYFYRLEIGEETRSGKVILRD